MLQSQDFLVHFDPPQLQFTDHRCPGGGVHLPDGPPLRHGGEDGPGGDGRLRQRV